MKTLQGNRKHCLQGNKHGKNKLQGFFLHTFSMVKKTSREQQKKPEIIEKLEGNKSDT